MLEHTVVYPRSAAMTARSAAMTARSRSASSVGLSTVLTVKEVAEHLKCSERFVVDELRRKTLRGAKLAAGWRVTERDLEVYLNARMNVSEVRRS